MSNQLVVFYAEAQIEEVVNSAKNTWLLGWFKANQDPMHIAAGAHDCLYQQFPKKFVWNPRHAVWKVHQQYKGIRCMYSTPAIAGKAFYLHFLLIVVKGKRVILYI